MLSVWDLQPDGRELAVGPGGAVARAQGCCDSRAERAGDFLWNTRRNSGGRKTMGALLETIHSPADLKCLSFAQMAELAEEIRGFLIHTLSKTGGHLGPNLGVVELTLAIHTVFNTPEDKLLFDVSHQAYIHKILTGRLDRFSTIRQPGGLTA